ncbi:Magnesium transporter NIPA [Trinorchestia longiramus]|nr:Magnesium transporter NIPA [Trinorchestia longiramus]
MTNVDVINTTVSNSSACHSKMDDDGDWSWTRVMAGTILAMTVQLMSGISIAVRKKALTAVALSGARPAGEGGLGYLKSKLWWLGFIMLVICQAAYGVSISLTSAVVAAPMAVLSIAGSAIGGRVIVKDWIGPFGWMGCVILMSGCAIFAISAPVDIDLATADEVNKLFTSINFISVESNFFLPQFEIISDANKNHGFLNPRISDNTMEDFFSAELLAAEAGNSEDISNLSTFNSTDEANNSEEKSTLEISVGIILAVLCNVFIGLSIVIRRRGLQNVVKDGQVRASEGGCGYWKSGTWWLGTLILLLAQLLMFGSLILAPAILVAPVGVLRILAATAAARWLLKETMKAFGWLGCLLVICGCVVFIVSGPKDKDISSMEEYNTMFVSPSFLTYFACIVILTIVLLALAPRYGSRFMLLNVLIEGCNGSISVWLGKGIGVAVATKSFTEWTMWLSVVLLLASLSIQFIVNNRSADLFDATLVMSSSYVIYTTGVILVSLILFSFKDLSMKDGVLMTFGFLVNVIGLIVMIKGKNIAINFFETNEHHNEKNVNKSESQENSDPVDNNKINRQSPVSLHKPCLVATQLRSKLPHDVCEETEFRNELGIAPSAAVLNKSFEVSPSDKQGRVAS